MACTEITCPKFFLHDSRAVLLCLACRGALAEHQSYVADGCTGGGRTRGKPLGKWTIEVVKRSDVAKGSVVLPRGWVVERTLAWLNRNRRLANDFEAIVESATTWLYVASVKLISRRRALRAVRSPAFIHACPLAAKG
jgi:hypothetical protein